MLVFERGFVVETRLFFSAQFFVEQPDLLLSFPPKYLLFASLLQETLFLKTLPLL